MSDIYIDVTDECSFTPSQGTELYDNTLLKVLYTDPETSKNYTISKNINVYPREEFNKPYNISYLANNCSNLFAECTNFDQPIFIGSNVDNCSNMFNNCKNFNSPVSIRCVGKPSRYNYVDVRNMFSDCQNFNQSVVFPDNVVLNHVGTFSYCRNLNQPIHLGNNVEYLNSTFYYCTNFNSPVTFDFIQDGSHQFPSINGLFYGCNNFNQSITLPDIHTGAYILNGCSNFNNYVSFYRCSNLWDSTRFFSGCANYNIDADLSACSKLYEVYQMFYNCTSFNKNIKLNWSNLRMAKGLMERCSSFGHFYECFADNLATAPKLEDCSSMFYGCTNLSDDVSHRDIIISNNVKYCNTMFHSSGIFNFGNLTFGTNVVNLCAALQDTSFIGNIYILQEQECNIYAMLFNKASGYVINVHCHNLAIINKTSARESITGYDMTWVQESTGTYYNSYFGIRISNQF